MKFKLSSTLTFSAIFLAFFNVLSRGVGFLREIVFAGYFGFKEEFNLYLIANTIPFMLFAIIYFIAQNYYIPLFNKLKENKYQIINKNLVFFTILISIIALLLFVFSDPILSSYMKGSPLVEKEKAVYIFNLFLINLPLTAINSYLIAYLQHNFEFKQASISQLLINVVVIAIVLIYSKDNIYILPICFVIGTSIQTLYLSIKCKALLQSFFSFISFKGIITYKELTFVYVILIEFASQLYIFIDRYFYTEVNKGGIIALNYATNIVSLPINIISFSLSTIILSKFSLSYSNKEMDQIKNTIKDLYLINLLFFIPISAIFFFWGDQIIWLLFSRGAFGEFEIQETFRLLRLMTITLFFYAFAGVVNRLYYSAGLAKFILITIISTLIIKFIFISFSVGSLKESALALSTAVIYLQMFIMFIVYLKKMNIHFSYLLLLKYFILNLLNGVFSYIIVDNFIETEIILVKPLVFSLIYIYNLYYIDDPSIQYLKNLRLLFK